MIPVLVMQEPKVGNVYKFVYDNKTRVALVRNDNGHNMECWDFTRDNFRIFSHDKVGPAEDVTKSVKTIRHFDEDDVERYEDAGCRVWSDFENDVLYVVNLA
jgi:hypothetical protein